MEKFEQSKQEFINRWQNQPVIGLGNSYLEMGGVLEKELTALFELYESNRVIECCQEIKHLQELLTKIEEE